LERKTHCSKCKKIITIWKGQFLQKHLTADNKYIPYGADSLEFIFDKTKGSVVCWTVDGNNLIESGTNNLTFWRAPTSRGDRFNAAYWKNYGLDTWSLPWFPQNLLKIPLPLVELDIKLQIAPKILAWRFEVDVNYRLSSTRLDIKTNLVPIGYTQQSLPKIILRVGWELGIPTAFEHCK
jgi:hypothetical protein